MISGKLLLKKINDKSLIYISEYSGSKIFYIFTLTTCIGTDFQYTNDLRFQYLHVRNFSVYNVFDYLDLNVKRM